jgi:hypothetical protein
MSYLNLLREGSPELIKNSYRLIRYPQQRKKVLREIGIKRKQDVLIKQKFDAKAENIIVFLVPGCNWETGKDEISGGVMSIVSLCEETAAIKELHHAETIMCTFPGDHLMIRHGMFENNIPVFRFSQLRDFFTAAKNILIHVPEFLAAGFSDYLSKKRRNFFLNAERVHINIMNQNIRLMPGAEIINELQKQSSRVTITTAHDKYCNKQQREIFGVPIHKFSVWISPEQYFFTGWEDKENLIVVSPDDHPRKHQVLDLLRSIPGLEVRIIKNLGYEDYKKLISRARWSLTFGEGLDGYFIEPVFSGAISFAVYNELFFTRDFKELSTVYDSIDLLEEKIVGDINKFESDLQLFNATQQAQFELCSRYYSKERYRENIAAFYSERYTYS